MNVDKVENKNQQIISVQNEQITKNEVNIFETILNNNVSINERKLKDILICINYCDKLSKSELSFEQEKKIRTFFDKLLDYPYEWNPCENLGNKYKLQRILSIDLYSIDYSPEQAYTKEQQFLITVAKARLAIKFGVQMADAGGGVNGAKFVLSLECKKIGVFKAPQKTGLLEVATRVKSVLGQLRLLNCKNKLNQQHAEVAAYTLNIVMNFDIAPNAMMVEFKKEQGVFIEFLDGFRPLKGSRMHFNSRKEFLPEEKTKWQKMCIFNFLAGNLDPHSENLFVQLDENYTLKEIRTIDFGNAFPQLRPSENSLYGNEGAWGKYTIAKEEFTEETLEFIRNNINEEKINEYFQSLKHSLPEFMNENMMVLMKERFKIVCKCLLPGIIKTPKELSEIHFDKHYKKYFELIEKK